MPTSFAEEVVDYLATSGVCTKGTDGFFNMMPDISASPCMAVRSLGGPAANAYTPWAQSNIQVLVRANDFETANLQAARAYNVMHGMQGALTNNYVLSCIAQGLPASIGPDERGRFLVSANYAITTRANTSSGEATSGTGGDKSPDLY